MKASDALRQSTITMSELIDIIHLVERLERDNEGYRTDLEAAIKSQVAAQVRVEELEAQLKTVAAIKAELGREVASNKRLRVEVTRQASLRQEAERMANASLKK